MKKSSLFTLLCSAALFAGTQGETTESYNTGDTLNINMSESYESGSIQINLPYMNEVVSRDSSFTLNLNDNMELHFMFNRIELPYMMSGPMSTVYSKDAVEFGEAGASITTLDITYPMEIIPFREVDWYEGLHKPIVSSEVVFHDYLGEQVVTDISPTIEDHFYAKDSSGRHFYFHIKEIEINLEDGPADPGIVMELQWMADSSGNEKFAGAVSNSVTAAPVKERQLHIVPLSNGIHVTSVIKGSAISADIIDSRGRLIQKLDGVGSLNFSYDHTASGVYFMRIRNNNLVSSVKIQVP